MIYFCADDYGLNQISSMRIQQGIDSGVLNKVSAFCNFDAVDVRDIQKDKQIRVSLHLNLVEGTCLSPAAEIPLLADENGKFRHAFGGLLQQSLFHRKEFETQVYKEIKAQILRWRTILPEGGEFCIDSHQHVHMIPAVFKMLVQVLKEEHITPDYLRIPVESMAPYFKTPSLYFTYSVANIIKQCLLSMLWIIDKKNVKEYHMSKVYFFGLLLSGKMDERRVHKILPHYIKKAQKEGRDLEVLFHPGYLNATELESENKNIQFPSFYLSENRKKEFDCVMRLAKRSVQECHILNRIK